MRIPIAPPKFTELIYSLNRHSLTPVIVFLTSRRACDEAVESFRGSHTVDISKARQEQIEKIIDLFEDEADLIRRHRYYTMLVRKGVAAHHAGHLPVWKHVVEKSMSAGLLNGVFATSTLAAGIDMPARSVVITASSLRSDEGHRDIKSFELAQMTGRAGRRGKDKIGFAVFIPGPFQDIHLIQEKLMLPPEPLESSFNANYTMVLNLLQQLSPESTRELVERSFRQFQNLKAADRLQPRLVQFQKLIDISNADCPAGDRAATYPKFTHVDRDLTHNRKYLKTLRRSIVRDQSITPDDWMEILEEQLRVETRKLDDLTEKREALPCARCRHVKTCGPGAAEVGYYQEELKRLQTQLYELEHGLWLRFEDCVHILQHYGYLTDDWRPTEQGIWASRLRVENTLFIAELLREGFFNTPDAQTLAAICGALAAEEREFPTCSFKKETFLKSLKKAMSLARSIASIQEDYNLYSPMWIDPDAARLLWAWADGKLEWDNLLKLTEASEGDLVRLILRTSDLLGQLAGLTDSHADVARQAREAMRLIRRPPVED